MRTSVLELLYGSKLQDIRRLNILLVGVGGIGCQVLKGLAKLPIESLQILDLDTIEISNLNRQFLFQAKHRGHSKALTAKQSVFAINPNLKITAHHSNIKQMEARFFKQFNIVIMALDNAQARSFVNQVCVLLNICIIDAGTSGYSGQVHFIQPKITSCFDCVPKSTDTKVFQVCTIRARPDKPIHCITWAKFVFEAIFGPYDEGNIINDFASFGTALKQDSSSSKINEFVVKVFDTDIKSLITDKSKPITQIPISTLSQNNPIQIESLTDSTLNNIQSISHQIAVFKSSFVHLLSQTQQFLTFEKDDPFIMSFISSAANIRMHVFNIPTLSFYSIKQTAGNIIPAIASTNSMVAAIQITQTIKYITSQLSKIRSVYLRTGKQKLVPTAPQKPNSSCNICSQSSKPIIIEKNFQNLSLKYLVDLIQKHKPGLNFSINMKIGTKDKKQLKQLINLADYEDQMYKQEYLQGSVRNFDKQRKIIQCFLLNEDTQNFLAYIYLMDNSTYSLGQEFVNYQGFSNQEIKRNTVQQQMVVQGIKNGEQIILDQSDSEIQELQMIVQQPPINIKPGKRGCQNNHTFSPQKDIKNIKLD